MKKTNVVLYATFFLTFLSSLPVQAQKKDSLNQNLSPDAPAQYAVQATKATGEDVNVFEKVEVEASVDVQKWRRQLEKHLQGPIKKAAKDGMKAGQYTINIRFLVEKDGSISDVRALNDPGYGLAEASEKVVKTGPRWTAGEYNGRKVRSYHTQPITFVISEK